MPQRCQIRWEICHLWWEIISHLLGLHQILQMKMTLLLHTLQLLLLTLQLLLPILQLLLRLTLLLHLPLLLLLLLLLLLRDLPESKRIPMIGRTTGSRLTTSLLQRDRGQRLLMHTEILLLQFQNLILTLTPLPLPLPLILSMTLTLPISLSLRHFTMPTLLLPNPPIPSPILKP